MTAKIKTNLFQISTALFFVFMLCFYSSYELYIVNADEFTFTITDVLAVLGFVSLVAAILIVLVLVFIPNKLSKFISMLLFTVATLVYIQGTFLNIDVGVLNEASKIDEGLLGNPYYDIIVWIVGTIISVYLYSRFTRKYETISTVVSLFIVAMLVLSGAVLFGVALSSGKLGNRATGTGYTNKNLTQFSTADNIIVFGLDMFDNDYITEIIQTWPEYLDELDGFVLYDNYTSVYPTTDHGFASLHRGEYFLNETSFFDYVHSDKHSYVDDLQEDSYVIQNYGGPSIPIRDMTTVDNYEGGKYVVKKPLFFGIRLYTLGAMKYYPNIIKPFANKLLSYLENDVVIDSQYGQYSYDNVDFHETLKSLDYSLTDSKLYKFIYTYGVHYRYKNDEFLNRTIPTKDDPVKTAKGAMLNVIDYIKLLKASGCYDNSTIIITADHGYYHEDGTLDHFTKPMMMIKTKNSKGELKYSHAPVCALDFPATIADIIGKGQENDFGKSILAYKDTDIRERLYYHYYLSESDSLNDRRRLIEFSVANDANEKNAYKLTGNEYTIRGSLINHVDYCKLCQYGDDEGKGPCRHGKTNDYPNTK